MSTQSYKIEAKLVARGANEFKNAFGMAEESVNKFKTAGSKISAVGDKMTAVGSAMTKRLTLPLLAVGTASVKTAADFESAMSEVKAISGATGDQMQDLEKLAREMGAATKFSASEAADGLKYMALAGWDVEQMSAALPAVLDLAAASGEDLGITSDIVTDALSAFGLEAEDAGKFADLLASASSNSNTNVSMLGESFKYVAPVMGALGVSTEDTALALGLMADNGIKGSQAGTQLRNMMTSLVDPTKAQAEVMEKYGIELAKNADGTINLQGTMDNLRSTLGGLSEDQQAQAASTLFGKNAMAGALAIVNTTEESYENLALATQDYDGAAKAMADTMMDNLLGAWTELQSAISEAAISIGEVLIPMVRGVVEKIKEWVTAFNNLDDSTKEIITKIGLWLAAIGPAFIVIGKLVTLVGKATTAIAAMGTAITLSAGQIVALIGVLTAVVGALVIYVRNVDNTRNNTRKLRKEIEDTEESFKSLKEELADNEAVVKAQTDRMIELADKTNRTAGENAELESLIKNLSAEYPELTGLIDEQTGELLKSGDAVQAYIDSALEQDKLNLLTEERTASLVLQKEAEENLAQAKKELAEAEADAAASSNISNQSRVADAKKTVAELQETYDEQTAGLVEIDEKIEESATKAQVNEEKVTEAATENVEARKDLKGEELIAYVEALDGMADADDEYAQRQIENLEKAQAAYDEYYEELATKTEDIYQKMGGLGDGAVEKIELTAADVKKNLEEQIADWNSWQTSLAEIQGRVPQVMVDELSKMGPAALPLLEEYNNMTDKELSEHVKLYEDKHALATQMAVEELGPLPDEAKNLLDQTTGYVHEVGADMYSEAKRFGQQGVEGYGSTKDDFANAAVDITDAGLNAASNKIGQMGDVGTETGEAYADGVGGEISTSTEAAKNLSDAAVEEARSFRILNAWDNAGINSARKYAYGIDSRLGMVKDSATSIADAAKNAAGAISTYSTGQNFGQTFANGIRSKWNQAYSAGYSLGLAANQGQKNALTIKSPSRVAKENAENFGQSFVDNLLKMKDKAFAAGKEFTQAALSPLEQPVNVSMGYPSSLSSTGGRQSGSVEYGGGITQNITIQSPEPMSAADNARRIKQASRELALEW